MSNAGVLNTIFGFDVAASDTKGNQEQATVRPTQVPLDPALWNVKRFGREQIRSLVQQVFFPVTVKAPRQVVFSAVDPGSHVEDICLQVAHSLAAQIVGSVCVVEALVTIDDTSKPSSPPIVIDLQIAFETQLCAYRTRCGWFRQISSLAKKRCSPPPGCANASTNSASTSTIRFFTPPQRANLPMRLYSDISAMALLWC